jgi:hypothetical protein
MNTQIILPLVLTLHIVGLILAIGVTIANFVTYKNFWTLYDADRQKGLSAFRAYLKLQPYGFLGLGLLILTGITMLWLFQWTFISLLWFKIKLSLVVLIFVNGFTLGMTSTMKLQTLLSEESKPGAPPPDVASIRKTTQAFQLIQLSLFFLIIVLSIFRFN